MDHFMLLEVLEGVEQLDGKASDQTQRESLEIVQLEEVVEVDAHKLKRYTQVLSEDDVVFHVNDVHGVIRVVFLEELEDFQFNSSLIVILLFILNNLESDEFFSFMIEALDCDTERAFPEELLNLIAIANVVPQIDFVVPFMVIIAVVVLGRVLRTLDLLTI